jgi:hypothetical protein
MTKEETLLREWLKLHPGTYQLWKDHETFEEYLAHKELTDERLTSGTQWSTPSTPNKADSGAPELSGARPARPDRDGRRHGGIVAMADRRRCGNISP